MCSPKHVRVPLEKVARFLPPYRWLTLNPPRAKLIMPVCVSVRARAPAGGPSSSVSPSTSSVSARRTTERERRQRRHARHFLHLSSRENAPFLEAWSEATEIRAKKWNMPCASEKRDFSGAAAAAAAPLNHSGGTPLPRDGSGGRAGGSRAYVFLASSASAARPPALVGRPRAYASLPPSRCNHQCRIGAFRMKRCNYGRRARRPVTHRNPVTMDMAAVLVPADSHSD